MFLLKKKNLWILLLIGFAIYFTYLHIQATGDYISGKREELEYIAKLNQEKIRNEELIKEEERAGSQKTIESRARSGLNYLKKDEILFVDGDKD